jgi:ferrous iron transport protein B
MKKMITVALAGNPNTGKTTIFNAMTGSHQKVGNYAGVTVEKRQGIVHYKGYDLHIYDLPGIYSLTAYSIDEVVARDFIIEEKPDIVIDVLDSTNIARNLYLCLQFQELNVPVIAALNLNDEAVVQGIVIDDKKLSAILKMPVVKTVGTSGAGVNALFDRVIEVFESAGRMDYEVSYGDEIEEDIQLIVTLLAKDNGFSQSYPLRWCAIKLIEKDQRAFELLRLHSAGAAVEKLVRERSRRIEEHFGRDASLVVSEQRYGYIHGAVSEAVRQQLISKETFTEVVDKLLLDRLAGFPIFLFILWAVFQLTFKLSEYPMAWIESFFSWMSAVAVSVIPSGMLRSLVVDGVIAGVGGVSSFIPLIIFLFMFISILEDSGYMARAAFIMDKFLHVFGLHGQSFLPMIIGFGCSVPAVMAARTLKNTRDRIITVIVTPFISCGAKLPVYMLLAGAFFSANAGNVVLSIYVIGVILALLSSFLLRKTVLRGDATPFVMELPPYRMPTLKGILWHVREKTFRYVRKAGLVLLPASILIWAVTTFPRPVDAPFTDDRFSGADISQQAETAKRQEALAQSYAGRAGRTMEPVLSTIGFDWKIGIAAITGFAAKEMVVSTLGVLYSVGANEDEKSDTLRDELRRDPHFRPLVAYVLMLFMLIVVPCFASISTIYVEIGGKWLFFAVAFWSVLAWGLCFMVFQTGRAFGL